VHLKVDIYFRIEFQSLPNFYQRSSLIYNTASNFEGFFMKIMI